MNSAWELNTGTHEEFTIVNDEPKKGKMGGSNSALFGSDMVNEALMLYRYRMVVFLYQIEEI